MGGQYSGRIVFDKSSSPSTSVDNSSKSDRVVIFKGTSSFFIFLFGAVCGVLFAFCYNTLLGLILFPAIGGSIAQKLASLFNKMMK